MLNFGHFCPSPPSSRCPGFTPPEILAIFGPPSQMSCQLRRHTKNIVSCVFPHKQNNKERHRRMNNKVHVGRKLATFSQKHGSCPFGVGWFRCRVWVFRASVWGSSVWGVQERETNLNDSVWVRCVHAQCSTTDRHLIAPLTKALCPQWSPRGGTVRAVAR